MKIIDVLFEKISAIIAEKLQPFIEKTLRNNIVEIVRLNLKPSDILVLKVKQKLPETVFARLNESLKEIFPQNKIVVLEEGIEISIIEIPEFNIFESNK